MGIDKNIDIKPKDYKVLVDLVSRYLPNTTVWAFGSRVKFTSTPQSDLDLAVFMKPEQKDRFYDLKEALAESVLPFKVDLLNWDEIPENFKKNIRKEYVVVQDVDAEKGNVPKNWKTYRLGEIAELRKEQVAPYGDEQPYIGLEHIEQQTLRLNGVGSSIDVISNKFKFYSGDILYGKLRPYFRKVYNPKFDGVCSTDIYVIKNKKHVSEHFLYYLIATEDFTNIANSGSSGTRMPRAEWKQLENSEWNVPIKISEQEQIASILSSLDDKIELNLQMNETLEAIAQGIFKEWFVDFKFPGFDGKLVDGLPKGWRMGRISEIYTTTSGGTPSRTKESYYQKGTIKWVKSKELNGGFIFDTEERITDEALKNSSAKLLPRHSFLIAMYGATVGEYSVLSTEATCNQAICVILPNDDYQFSYIFEYFKINKDFIISQASGSAQQNISQAVIQQQEILIPPKEIVRKFHTLVIPLYGKIEENLFENQTLAQLRDSLLPRLMSGKIQVTA